MFFMQHSAWEIYLSLNFRFFVFEMNTPDIWRKVVVEILNKIMCRVCVTQYSACHAYLRECHCFSRPRKTVIYFCQVKGRSSLAWSTAVLKFQFATQHSSWYPNGSRQERQAEWGHQRVMFLEMTQPLDSAWNSCSHNFLPVLQIKIKSLSMKSNMQVHFIHGTLRKFR